ncbi:hypothetical protein H9P43_001484 [Blastocladiella emersonii ATCC 22665]|nr:hypothetical protein H9P43_001484 [Blastocladiella emersonii ATCC 22665]
MSNQTYTNAWREISADIAQQQEYENPKDPALIPKDRDSALLHLTHLYAKYVRIFQRLEIAHDQILHPQKKRLLRDLLMAVMGRLLEISLQIYEIDASDFPDMDSVYFDLKMIPDDLSVPVPRCFAEERAKVLKEREALLDSKGARPLAIENKVAFPELTVEEAVAILQRNERGRQGRIRAKYMRDIRQQEDQDADLDGTHDELQVVKAVQKIQRVWRGYLGRRLAAEERRKEAEFLGMATIPSFTQRNIMTANMKQRKDLQAQHEEEYQQALVSVKEKIRKVEGPDMKESYQDAFRQWYMDFKRDTSKFPDFPPDEEWKLPGFKFGQKPAEPAPGTAAEAAAPATPSGGKGKDAGKRDAGKKDAGKKDAGKKDAKKGGKGGDAAEEPEPLLVNTNSNYLKAVQDKQTAYLKDWRSKDETDNFAQRHDVEIIKGDKRLEVDTEIKDELFAALREELENLKLAMEKDSKKKKKDGGKKKKKDKKGGGKKGKKEKDLTGGRPIEELVDELVAAGLMQRPVKCRIADYKAMPSLMNKDKLNPEPSSFDIKRSIIEHCILPLGLDGIDDTVIPPPPRSILLYGPTGCGKTMLINAAANEAGATLFNLSPKTTAGQYTGKSNVARMVYTVFKVAKAMAPSLVVVDDAEAVFCKKVPKEDTSDPKRVRKDLVKAINGLKPSDRVLVVGTSRNPFYSDAKAMSDAFQRMIHVPRPNYTAREAIWREWIAERAAAGANNDTPPAVLLDAVLGVNCSVLARVSAGMPGATIQAIVHRTLTARRVRQLPQRALDTGELVHHMLQLPEPDRKIEQDFRDWTLKLPLFKKREIVLGLVQEEPVPEKGKGKDAKKKK